jgi:hypothetical protein
MGVIKVPPNMWYFVVQQWKRRAKSVEAGMCLRVEAPHGGGSAGTPWRPS